MAGTYTGTVSAGNGWLVCVKVNAGLHAACVWSLWISFVWSLLWH